MGNEYVFMMLPFIIGLTFVGFIALGVAAINDGKSSGRAEVLRRLYVYLVSFITLLVVAGSVIALVDLGLRTWAFTEADPAMGSSSYDYPPSLYLSSKSSTEVPGGALSCADGCTLSENDRSEIASWKANYENWQDRQDVGVQRAQALVTPLSFLIIAGIVFTIHWWLVRKDEKEFVSEHNLTRQTYFTAHAVVWLIVVVFTAGILLNTILRQAVPGSQSSRYTTSVPLYERQGVDSLVTCAGACGIDASTVAAAQSWQTDHEAYQERAQRTNEARDNHNTYATVLAYLLVAGPLFWLHFRVGWRRKGTPAPGA